MYEVRSTNYTKTFSLSQSCPSTLSTEGRSCMQNNEPTQSKTVKPSQGFSHLVHEITLLCCKASPRNNRFHRNLKPTNFLAPQTTTKPQVSLSDTVKKLIKPRNFTLSSILVHSMQTIHRKKLREFQRKTLTYPRTNDIKSSTNREHHRATSGHNVTLLPASRGLSPKRGQMPQSLHTPSSSNQQSSELLERVSRLR